MFWDSAVILMPLPFCNQFFLEGLCAGIISDLDVLNLAPNTMHQSLRIFCSSSKESYSDKKVVVSSAIGWQLTSHGCLEY